jgi:hypothetical protein
MHDVAWDDYYDYSYYRCCCYYYYSYCARTLCTLTVVLPS